MRYLVLARECKKGWTDLETHTAASLYDKFLLAVSMGFNVVTIWYAWNWVGT